MGNWDLDVQIILLQNVLFDFLPIILKRLQFFV